MNCYLGVYGYFAFAGDSNLLFFYILQYIEKEDLYIKKLVDFFLDICHFIYKIFAFLSLLQTEFYIILNYVM